MNQSGILILPLFKAIMLCIAVIQRADYNLEILKQEMNNFWVFELLTLWSTLI